jgi:hypothetical protein
LRTAETVAHSARSHHASRAASRLSLNRIWEVSGRVTGEFSNLGQNYSGIGSIKANW